MEGPVPFDEALSWKLELTLWELMIKKPLFSIDLIQVLLDFLNQLLLPSEFSLIENFEPKLPLDIELMVLCLQD